MPVTILIIDDDADDRILFCEAVRQVDDSILCLEADGSEEALAMLRNKTEVKPDFIFLDLNMPGIDGKQLMSKFKAMPSLNHVPIVIYTTSKLSSDERELKHLGADVFFTKPSKLLELKCNIENVISRKWERIKFRPNPFEE
jgi:CheY-like chemotaxis protein